jgi:hypothetical protein
MAKVKVLAYKKLPQDSLATNVHNSVDLMTADAQFASAAAEVTEMKTRCTVYENALRENLVGGRMTTILKNDCKKALLQQMDVVAQLVNFISKGSELVILAAGFDISKPAQRYSELETPILLSATNEKATGVVTIYFEKVGGAVNYGIEHRIVVEGETLSVWKNGEYSTRAKCRITGLEAGKYYQFRIRAIGNNSLVSDWSNTEEVLVS